MADAILKRCCTCQRHKPHGDFGVCRSTKDQLKKRCKSCHNADNARYRMENPETARASSLNWQKANRDKANAKHRRFVEANPGYMAQKQKEWTARNPDRAQDVVIRFREKNKIHRTVANRIRQSLHNKNGAKTFEILGYTVQALKDHLEKQFTRGMSWDNFGKWHIDHIQPLSQFQITDKNDPDLKVAWCLTNLRPLWAEENLKKSAKRLYLV